MPRKVIALLTDFGYKDPYVGQMKAVIRSIAKDVDAVDVTHGISRQNVLEGAIALWSSYRWFPRGTVFVVVVDPGVGSSRRALAIETSRYYFVGPDNGVLWLAVKEDGIRRAVELDPAKVGIGEVSATFHGRDLFSPAAALLARGVDINALGRPVDVGSLMRLDLTIRGLEAVQGNVIRAQAVYIDVYGNVALNVRGNVIGEALRLGDRVYLSVGSGKRVVAKVVRSFSEVEPGEYALYVNSYGLIELAKYYGSAAADLNIKVGDEVCIER